MLVSALIETTAPICIEKWEDYKMLGRFTLRDEGESSSYLDVQITRRTQADEPLR